MNKSATILTHPRFDRPKVDNPVVRGRKAGCISLASERRRRHVIVPQMPERKNFARPYIEMLATGDFRLSVYEDDAARVDVLLLLVDKFKKGLLEHAAKYTPHQDLHSSTEFSIPQAPSRWAENLAHFEAKARGAQ